MTNKTFTQAEIDEYRSFIEDQMSGYFTDAQLIEMMAGDEPEMTNKTNTFPKLTAAQERAWQLVLDWHDEYVQHASDPAEYFIAGGSKSNMVTYRIIAGTEITFNTLVAKGLLTEIKGDQPRSSYWKRYTIHPDFVPEYFDDEPATPAPEPAPAAAPAPMNNAPVEPEAKFKVGDKVLVVGSDTVRIIAGVYGFGEAYTLRTIPGAEVRRYAPDALVAYVEPVPAPAPEGAPLAGERREAFDALVASYEAQIHDLVTELTDALARVKELEADMERLAAREMELVQQNKLLNSVVDRLGQRAATLETENAELKARLAENHIQTAEERAADWGKWNKGS